MVTAAQQHIRRYLGVEAGFMMVWQGKVLPRGNLRTSVAFGRARIRDSGSNSLLSTKQSHPVLCNWEMQYEMYYSCSTGVSRTVRFE